MASLVPLSLFIPSPPSTAAFPLPSLHPLRRPTAFPLPSLHPLRLPTAIIFSRTMRPPRLFCWDPSPYDFSWDWEIEDIEPPMRVEIFPELPPIPIPLPPPIPSDPPLEHVEDDEGEVEEDEDYFYSDDEELLYDSDEFYFDDEPHWEDWVE